jgi:hypothetical protein
MGWLAKRKDPLAVRSQALRTQIQHLEAQIRDLSEPEANSHTKTQFTPLSGRPTVPAGAVAGGRGSLPGGPPSRPKPPSEQVFEKVDHQRLQNPPEAGNHGLYNELGVRKYDLPGAWQRLRSLFSGADAQNPAFIKLLAAGNIQGLRPLRYEKRVARRRFIVFVILLFLALWAIISMFLRH